MQQFYYCILLNHNLNDSAVYKSLRLHGVKEPTVSLVRARAEAIRGQAPAPRPILIFSVFSTRYSTLFLHIKIQL